VQTEPDDAPFAADQPSDFFDRDITLPPPVAIEGAGDNATLHFGGFDINEIKHISQKP
jgi:hypothetical protein